MATLPIESPLSQRDASWDLCRNNLGIARLLAYEGRPEVFVRTAARMAAETACRAALAQLGLRFDGDLGTALRRLAAPPDLWATPEGQGGVGWLSAAERVVGWMAAYLRSEAPDHPWGY